MNEITNIEMTNIRKVSTRFMDGNIDLDGCIFSLLVDEYGMSEVCKNKNEIDFDEAIYSNGFIHAIEEGMIPMLNEIAPSFESKIDGEYHHFIHKEECFVMYFKEVA